MSVDILYVAYNRLAFTEASFEQLIAATDWDLVRRLVIHDDGSTDGSAEYLLRRAAEFAESSGVEVDICVKRVGGPVAVMNHYLDFAPAEIMVKCDNDVVVPPGWLNVLLATAKVNSAMDAIGFEPGFGDGLAPIGRLTTPRTVKAGPHIGGVGLIRTRIFQRHRPRANGTFFGWTEFQRHHAKCGWLSPDIPSLLLDHLPTRPWRELSAEYTALGWSRGWPLYDESKRDYYEWWLREQAAVTA